MASTPLYSNFGVDDLLKEGDRTKQYAHKVAEDYVAKSGTFPNDSIHPLLRFQCTTSIPLGSNNVPVSTTLLDIDHEAKVGEDAFKEAMRDYEKTAKPKYKTGIDPDDQHTAKQLQDVVKQAIEKRQMDDSKGFWGKIALAFKSLADGTNDIEAWLGLLPTESHYLSVVCGGLKLILKAASRLKEVKDKVLEALQQIPALIHTTERVLHIYQGSERLRSLSKTFYLSVLATLGHILHYLRRASSKRLAHVLARPGSFENELLKKMDKMRSDREAFNEEANICERKMLHSHTTETKEGFHIINARLTIAEDNRSQAHREILETVNAQGRNILSGLIRVIQEGDVSREHSVLMLRQLDAPGHTPEPRTGSRIALRSAKKRGTVMDHNGRRRWILSQLDYDRNAAGADMVSNYNFGQAISRDDQERVLFLIKSDKLSDWVTVEHSTVLLVNGNGRDVQRKSAFTFTCARLAFALEQIRSPNESLHVDRPDIVPLYFFCGQHASGDISWETPTGVVNSLLAQLLTQCKDLDLIQVVGMGSFNNGSLKAIFKRFECVLEQVSSRTTVFCVIDGLSFYLDKSKTSKEAEYLVYKLLKLARPKSRKLSCIFKLLLTAPIRLHTSEIKSLSEDKILNVPYSLPNTGGFTSMKWNLSIGQQAKGLAKAE